MPRPGVPRQAAAWVRWHLYELGAVGLPVVLAVTVSAWWAVPAAVLALAWVVYEVRARRHQEQ